MERRQPSCAAAAPRFRGLCVFSSAARRRLREDAQFHVAARDLVDGVEEGGDAQVGHARVRALGLQQVLERADHRLLEARVHEIRFVRPLGDSRPLGVRERLAGGGLDRPQHLQLVRLLVPLLHAAEAHVREVLQPLEVRHGDAAGVAVDVGDDQDALLAEHRIGLRRGRAVGALER